MRFALKTATQNTTWPAICAVWRRADEGAVFESAWLFDHFYPIFSDPTGPCLESWVTLAALSRETTRIRLGSMVNAVPYRHPAVVANMAAALDITSDGRLELGLGAGWNVEEASAYGIDLGPVGERMDRFDEAVEVIVRLLRADERQLDFAGRHYNVTAAYNEPKPVQRPHPPITIGGQGERRTLKTVARWAQHWNCSGGDPDHFRAKREVLLRHCDDVGRDPAEITCSIQVGLTAESAERKLTELVPAYEQAGADLLVVAVPPPHSPHQVDAVERAASRFTDG